jgi:hypothetical protein
MSVGLQTLRDLLRGGSRARALVSLVLLAFVLQIAVTRGHFHFGHALDSVVATAPAQDAVADQAAGGSKPGTPSHDESNCPLWHAAGVCGAAAPAVGAVLFIAAPAPSRIATDERSIVPERFTAAWRSRAPPSL